MSHTRRKYIRNGIPYRSSRLQDGKLVYLYIIKLVESYKTYIASEIEN